MGEKSPIEKAAELFNLLSHPIRISIIKVVYEEGPISFSGLMKALNIESSSLGFHLKQLESCLIRDENGNYTLSEKGKSALRALQSFNIVRLSQNDIEQRKKLDIESWWFITRRAPQPGNWGIGVGTILAFIGLVMFIWNPIYSILIIVAGIIGVCISCWINYRATKTLLEITKEKEETTAKQNNP